MKLTRNKLFAPVLAGLIGVGAFASYQLGQSKNIHIVDSAYATEASMIAADQAPKAAPDFELKDVNGKTVHLSDYKGKVVVLNFWATWCPPCRKEIPDFNDLQKEYGAKGVQFLGIALDDEGMAKVKPFMAANTIAYPVLLPDATIANKYGALLPSGDMSAIPVTFVIDRNGMIRSSYVGMRQKAVLEGMLSPLLAGK